MANLAIYNLIVYNLLQINLRNVVIFHCWQLPVLFPLAQLFSRNLIFSQFISLNQSNESLANFSKDYLDSELTKLGVFLDLSCEQSPFITNQSSRAQLYTHRYHWLLYDEAGNMNRFMELFERANLSINADVNYVQRQPVESFDPGSLFILYDVYNKGSQLGGQLNITIDLNIYCNQTECELVQYLSELHKRSRLQQRTDLSGITFRQVALVTIIPLSSGEEKLLAFLNSEEDYHLDWTSRVGYRQNVHLQELLRFNVRYIWRNQWSLGETKGGALGEVTSANADLSTTAFVLSPERLRHVFPTAEVSQFRSICIFRTPHNAGIKAGVFLEPFKLSVWLVFGAVLMFSGVLLWLTFRLEHRWMRHCLQYYVPSLLSSCLISFGAACIQGSHLIPRSTGGRLAFIAVMFTSFLMYNYYTSIVVSSLLGSPVRSNIKTIQQLADSSLDVGFETIPFTRVYLNSSPRSDIRDLVKHKVEGRNPSNIWLSAREGVLRARDQPGFVFVSEASFLYTFIEKYYLPHEICELNEIMFRPESAVYTVIHINSTYKELLKLIQLRMMETGITQKHKFFYTKTKLHCYANNYVINVGMEYAAPLFIALLLSYFASIFILILELAWAHLGRRHLRHFVTGE
ncbi:ionotropic receptor 75a [Drosophila montana]|uniref:ionotropic receptor 75a n=1 Tax=Drosophila montana TaxID=40370 RepID=UPI00313D7E77